VYSLRRRAQSLCSAGVELLHPIITLIGSRRYDHVIPKNDVHPVSRRPHGCGRRSTLPRVNETALVVACAAQVSRGAGMKFQLDAERPARLIWLAGRWLGRDKKQLYHAIASERRILVIGDDARLDRLPHQDGR
jgi:hypothetical protein